jgi:hypothetical protein
VTAVSSGPGCPTLTLDNPPPGAQISAGDYLISGQAFDPAAAQQPGVSRIDIFFGSRETGGQLIGTAIPGQTNVTAPGQPTTPSTRDGGFTVKVNFTSGTSRGDNLVAYAYSSTGAGVTSVSIPILVGTEPTPTPTGSNNTPVPVKAVTNQTGCAPGGGAQSPVSQAAVSQASPAAAAGAASPAAAAAATTGGPTIKLDNPKSGDMLPVGDTIVYGSTSGGVDRVDIFSDNRDAGGIFMGGGAPGADGRFAIKITVNANQSGGHTLFAYGKSTASGREAATSVPVFLVTEPTPTPRT